MVYEDAFFEINSTPENGNLDFSNDISQETEERVKNLAKSWKLKKIDLVCLDVERWPVQGDDQNVQKTIDKFLKIINWIRSEDPSVKIGVFGRPPVFDFFKASQSVDSKNYRQWQAENKRLVPLANSVDVLFPSLYTHTTDPKAWNVFALASLKEASNYRKPVYAFLWPRYEISGDLYRIFLPQPYWESELQTIREHADGLVIWDGGKGQPWDDKAAWWQTTLTKLREWGF